MAEVVEMICLSHRVKLPYFILSFHVISCMLQGFKHGLRVLLDMFLGHCKKNKGTNGLGKNIYFVSK